MDPVEVEECGLVADLGMGKLEDVIPGVARQVEKFRDRGEVGVDGLDAGGEKVFEGDVVLQFAGVQAVSDEEPVAQFIRRFRLSGSLRLGEVADDALDAEPPVRRGPSRPCPR